MSRGIPAEAGPVGLVDDDRGNIELLGVAPLLRPTDRLVYVAIDDEIHAIVPRSPVDFWRFTPDFSASFRSSASR